MDRIKEWVKSAALTVLMALWLAVGAVSGYLVRHKLPTFVFGGLFFVICIVMTYAGVDGRKQLAEHIAFREFVIHLPWGAALYLLFSVLMPTWERRRNRRHVTQRRFGWFVGLLTPVAVTLACAAIQEFGFSVTELLDGGSPWGGDWNRPGIDLADQLKSIADLAGWAFGALAAAWYAYKMPEPLWHWRQDYLRSRA